MFPPFRIGFSGSPYRAAQPSVAPRRLRGEPDFRTRPRRGGRMVAPVLASLCARLVVSLGARRGGLSAPLPRAGRDKVVRTGRLPVGLRRRESARFVVGRATGPNTRTLRLVGHRAWTHERFGAGNDAERE